MTDKERAKLAKAYGKLAQKIQKSYPDINVVYGRDAKNKLHALYQDPETGNIFSLEKRKQLPADYPLFELDSDEPISFAPKIIPLTAFDGNNNEVIVQYDQVNNTFYDQDGNVLDVSGYRDGENIPLVDYLNYGGSTASADTTTSEPLSGEGYPDIDAGLPVVDPDATPEQQADQLFGLDPLPQAPDEYQDTTAPPAYDQTFDQATYDQQAYDQNYDPNAYYDQQAYDQSFDQQAYDQAYDANAYNTQNYDQAHDPNAYYDSQAYSDPDQASAVARIEVAPLQPEPVAPVVEPTAVPIVESAPIVEVTPTVEPTPTPVVETAPVVEAPKVVEPTPTPVVEATPAPKVEPKVVEQPQPTPVTVEVDSPKVEIPKVVTAKVALQVAQPTPVPAVPKVAPQPTPAPVVVQPTAVVQPVVKAEPKVVTPTPAPQVVVTPQVATPKVTPKVVQTTPAVPPVVVQPEVVVQPIIRPTQPEPEWKPSPASVVEPQPCQSACVNNESGAITIHTTNRSLLLEKLASLGHLHDASTRTPLPHERYQLAPPSEYVATKYNEPLFNLPAIRNSWARFTRPTVESTPIASRFTGVTPMAVNYRNPASLNFDSLNSFGAYRSPSSFYPLRRPLELSSLRRNRSSFFNTHRFDLGSNYTSFTPRYRSPLRGCLSQRFPLRSSWSKEF